MGTSDNMQVYRLVGQASEAALRAIYLSQSHQPVRKLAYCPQVHVLFVSYCTLHILCDYVIYKLLH